MKLSILTASVPSRISKLETLIGYIAKQIGDLPVEHLVFIDNKRRTVGEKRDALLRMSHGEYVAYVDDDDWISEDYVYEILKAIEQKPDVVTFWQLATVNDLTSEVRFRVNQENGPFVPEGITHRGAWHVCAWRKRIAVCSHFPSSNHGEDWAFVGPLNALPGLSEVHISKVLHFYRHSSETTEAPPPA
jgi:glycosyltransferase involved in cell wall biosynthesis